MLAPLIDIFSLLLVAAVYFLVALLLWVLIPLFIIGLALAALYKGVFAVARRLSRAWT